MNKKIFALCLAFLITVVCVPLTGFAEINYNYNDTVYNYILDDYLLATGLEKTEADAIYNEIKDSSTDMSSEELENIIYGTVSNVDYVKNVIYIQDNYNEITTGITEEEKAIVDKYFLAYALEYYVDNGSPEDFVDDPMTVSSCGFIDEPVFIDNEDFEEVFVDENETILQQVPTSTRASEANVVSVRVFADPSKSTIGSSGLEIDLGTHAWITVSNTSSSNVTVGKFNVAAGKTMSLGTWGNKSEHKGLWYNLESYFIKNNSSYGNRVSLRVDLTATNLSALNNTIVGYDKWSVTNNCSSFAVTCWNKVCSTKLSAGVINTPKNLAGSIKGISGYSTGFSVPHNYKVYYANGSSTPILSSTYN